VVGGQLSEDRDKCFNDARHGSLSSSGAPPLMRQMVAELSREIAEAMRRLAQYVPARYDGPGHGPALTCTARNGSLIMQGVEGSQAWNLLLTQAMGKMSATVADDQVGFVIFGACTPF
jgi:hypothetical protein